MNRSSTVSIVGILALTVAASFVSAPAGAELALVSPRNKVFVESELLSVVIKVDREDEFDRVGVAVRNRSNREPRRKTVAVKRPFVCKTIKLCLGMNQILVFGVKEGKTVEEKRFTVFYRSDLSDRNREAPSGYTQYRFHSSKREEPCEKCHAMSVAETDGMPETPDKSTCHTCHRRITDYKFVHGPSSVWSCPSCHGTDESGGKYGVMKPDSELCSMCHEEMLTEWSKKRYRHGPSMVSCTICHSPHGSNEPFFVHIHTTSLCVGCHEEKASGAHVVEGFGGGAGGHPTRGRPDPIRKGREFTCAGCHNPHAGDTQNLLYYDNSTGAFCLNCHKK